MKFSDAFLFLRAQNVGIAPELIPILYAISNIVLPAAQPFSRLADKIGPYKIMIGGYAIFALTHIGFATIASVSTVWLLFPMFGLFSAMTEGVQKMVAVKISDPELKGSMLGLMHTTIGLVQLPAGIIAGLLWEKINVSVPFFFSSITAVIAIIMMLFVMRITKLNQVI